jgi:hypothetical protein
LTHSHDDQPSANHHDCGNLFGWGDEKGTGVIREDITDAAFDKRAADRLTHMEMDQQRLDGFLTARVGCADNCYGQAASWQHSPR